MLQRIIKMEIARRVLTIGVLMSLATDTLAVRCYECQYDEMDFCQDPFLPSNGARTVDCPVSCIKGKGRYLTQRAISRGCPTNDFSGDYCKTDDDPDNPGDYDYCLCSSDYCNSAVSIAVSRELIVLALSSGLAFLL